MFVNIKWDSGRKCGIIESDYIDNIREHFSVKDKSASIRQFYNRYIPSRKYAITNGGRFEMGLFVEIYKYLQSLSIPFDITVDGEFCKQFKPSYAQQITRLSALKLDLRDYQTESVRKCIKQGNGVLKLATGAGKTLLMASLVKTLHENIKNHFTVIIVPSIQLVEQTFKDFTDYGIDPSLISKLSGDNEFEMGKPIIIAGSQILLVSKQIPDLIFSADLLVIDEVHGLRKDNKLNKVIKKFDTPHKFGLTGSLPPDPIDVWNIIGKIGPIIYEKESSTLRDEGYLAEVEAQILRIHYKEGPAYSIPSLANPLVAYNEEREFTMCNTFRCRLLSNLAKRTTQNTLVVVERIVHGEILEQLFKENSIGKRVFFIRGSVEVEDREKIRELMEENDNIVVVAIAKIFATGINIKNLPYIILAVSGKAQVRLIQTIGRGLRLHENKEKLIILDISDQLKYGSEHEKERVSIYESEKIPFKITDIYEKEE